MGLAAAIKTFVGKCRWCETTIIKGRRHGHFPIYCSPAHKQAFWKSLTLYALREYEAGKISIEALKELVRSVDALLHPLHARKAEDEAA
jgi:hypothetical protein